MKIGFLGLGKMGYNIALNAIDNNFEIIGYFIACYVAICSDYIYLLQRECIYLYIWVWNNFNNW